MVFLYNEIDIEIKILISLIENFALTGNEFGVEIDVVEIKIWIFYEAEIEAHLKIHFRCVRFLNKGIYNLINYYHRSVNARFYTFQLLR